MKYNCEEIVINDEDFGITVTLSEKEDGDTEMNITMTELMNSSGQYLLLQKTYAEDGLEDDSYYIESNNNYGLGELKNFKN